MSAASAKRTPARYWALPRLLAGWTVAALLVAGCSSASSGGGGKVTTTSGGQVAFGVLSCFTGTLASLGEAMLQGSHVGMKAINDAGGVLGHKLTLAHADTQCDEADSVPALRQLLAANSAV